jgi:hypothetical protein
MELLKVVLHTMVRITSHTVLSIKDVWMLTNNPTDFLHFLHSVCQFQTFAFYFSQSLL